MKTKTSNMVKRIFVYTYMALTVYTVVIFMVLGTKSIHRDIANFHAQDQMRRADRLIWDVDFCLKYYNHIPYPLTLYMIREGLDNAQPIK